MHAQCSIYQLAEVEKCFTKQMLVHQTRVLTSIRSLLSPCTDFRGCVKQVLMSFYLKISTAGLCA